MLPFQTVLAILMAATVNMALAAPEISAAAMILATTIVDTVVSSGVQHPVVGPRRGADGKFLPLRAINEPTCFDSSTFPNAGKHNSALVPWTALANQTDSEAELAVFNTLTTICNKFSSTIMTRNIQYTHCEPDSHTNGTYGIIAQMTYLGPQDVLDMRGNPVWCLEPMNLIERCAYGGSFEELHLSYSPKNSVYWNVQARPILGACPDCTGGLLP